MGSCLTAGQSPISNNENITSNNGDIQKYSQEETTETDNIIKYENEQTLPIEPKQFFEHVVEPSPVITMDPRNIVDIDAIHHDDNENVQEPLIETVNIIKPKKDSVAQLKQANTSNVILIGSNYQNSMISHKSSFKKLTVLNRNELPNMTHIYSGKGFTIYCNHDTYKYYGVGDNLYGQIAIDLTDNTQQPINLTRIKYFKRHRVKIKKVFSNPKSICTFWLTDKGKLYRAGLISNETSTDPVLIKQLRNIIDIKINSNMCIALSGKNDNYKQLIIGFWLFSNNFIYTNTNIIPQDIIDLIAIFCRINRKVLVWRIPSILYSYSSAEWEEIPQFEHSDIVKIECGSNWRLCLEANGTLWCCVKYAIEVKVEFSVKIIDIACGYQHNLAIDSNYNVYAWGGNSFGQLGDGSMTKRDKPKLIDTLKEYNIVEIKCGNYHSYAGSDDGEHFLWGSNTYNECVISNKNSRHQKIPYCINKQMNKITNGKSIKFVSLGESNTKFIVE